MNKELAANTTISHYRIVSKSGAGGMGEVYLAKDTKLDRKVAIRLVHEEFSRDLDQLGRFYSGSQRAILLLPTVPVPFLGRCSSQPLSQKPDHSGLNES